jgi:hypothetical protein
MPRLNELADQLTPGEIRDVENSAEHVLARTPRGSDNPTRPKLTAPHPLIMPPAAFAPLRSCTVVALHANPA